MKTLGEHIRELREDRDWSVRDLAKKLKVSAAFLSDVELGRRHPSEEVLEKLASAFETTTDDLRKHDARPPVQELILLLRLLRLADQRFSEFLLPRYAAAAWEILGGRPG